MGPAAGMNLQGYPILDFLVELAFGIAAGQSSAAPERS
jgi:hypothetical protein